MWLVELGAIVVVVAISNIRRPNLSVVVKGSNGSGSPIQSVNIIITR